MSDQCYCNSNAVAIPNTHDGKAAANVSSLRRRRKGSARHAACDVRPLTGRNHRFSTTRNAADAVAVRWTAGNSCRAHDRSLRGQHSGSDGNCNPNSVAASHRTARALRRKCILPTNHARHGTTASNAARTCIHAICNSTSTSLMLFTVACTPM